MTTGRSEIQQVLDYAEKLKYFHTVAEKLRDIVDLDQSREESEAKLANAKAREEQFAADSKRARDAEAKRHQETLQASVDAAQAALAKTEEEAEAKGKMYRAQTDRDVSERTSKLGALSHQIEVAQEAFNDVVSETETAKAELAALRAETDAVEARLKKAKDAVAALLA